MPDSSDIDVVRRAIDALRPGHMAEYLDAFADDGVAEFPFVEGFPGEIDREVLAGLSGLMDMKLKTLEFFDVTIRATDEAGLFVIEMRSEGDLHSGERYENRYVVFVAVRDGKITRWREYNQPMAALKLLA